MSNGSKLEKHNCYTRTLPDEDCVKMTIAIVMHSSVVHLHGYNIQLEQLYIGSQLNIYIPKRLKCRKVPLICTRTMTTVTVEILPFISSSKSNAILVN